ncbi:MAG: DMT family transporter, partial [Bacteroidales bacterium]|nr:DMT family transporter [Bacteroidales bacterium]
MAYLGELISIGVALSWTVASLWSEVSSKRLGAQVMNTWRMAISVVVYALLSWVLLGAPYPVHASAKTWLWLSLSGFIGFFLGDICLLGSYVIIGARTGQLFMTLAPAFATFFGWLILGQSLSWKSLLAMVVTMSGIGLTVMGHGHEAGRKVSLQIPLKGALLGIGAALGQGLGLVISGIGMNHYLQEIPADLLPGIEIYIPFSANMIRCITGFIACLALVLVTKPKPGMSAFLHDGKSMRAMAIVVLTGPVLGVGFSLMALRYTAAGIASTLQSTTPILLLLPSHWMFGEKITMRSIVGAIVSVIGASLFFLL